MRIDRVKLKTELAKRDMKQYRLAEMANVSKGTIAGITNGRSCSSEVGEKIAKALNLDISDLLEEQR